MVSRVADHIFLAVFDYSNFTVMDSNSARGLNVCPRFSVLSCYVCVQTLQCAYPS
jgi:hypothetical protein